MKAEDKVKAMFPEAALSLDASNGRILYTVTIMPGRYAHGSRIYWAWKNALDSILQDAELTALAKSPAKKGASNG